MDDVGGEDMHWFFDQWVYHAGHPGIEYTVQVGTPTSQDVTVFVHQTQYNPATHTPYFRFPLSLDVNLGPCGTSPVSFWFNAQEYQSVTQSFRADVVSADLTPFQNLLYAGTAVSVAPQPPAIAGKFELGAVYPNPFNSVARVPFKLARSGDVQIRIFDLLGRNVQTLSEAKMSAGRHEAVFSPIPAMASGVYLISLESGGNRSVTKAMFLK